MKAPELLAPAGSLEKAKFALMYGADAIYFGVEHVSLRHQMAAFTLTDVRELMDFAHDRHKFVYAAVNGLPRNADLPVYRERIKALAECGVDAVILASPALIDWTHRETTLPIHVSTQHGAANSVAIRWLSELGASRIVLPRELAISEIAFLAKNSPVELEVFIHGGMCSAISGRCGLSAYLSGRDANRGLCAHSCRWNYQLHADMKPETEPTSFVMASKDLRTLSLIPSLMAAGVASLKIEGRMKSVHYVACVTQAYRHAIDAVVLHQPFDLDFWTNQIRRAEIRDAGIGFYHGDPGRSGQIERKAKLEETGDFLGVVVAVDTTKEAAWVDVRNKLICGDEIEVLHPDGSIEQIQIMAIEDESGTSLALANIPKRKIRLIANARWSPYDILRKVKTWNDPY
jgi:putative protease